MSIRYASYNREHFARFFLASLLSFSLYATLTVVVRSHQRHSLLGSSAGFGSSAGEDNSRSGEGEASSKLELHNFQRLAIKAGLPAWEVKAKGAEYYQSEGVSHLQDAKLRVFREKGAQIQVQARSARLHLGSNSLSRAELAGEVLLEIDQDLTLKAELALYDVSAGTLSVAGPVEILGPGYQIKAVGLSADLNQQIVRLAEKVESEFTMLESGQEKRKKNGGRGVELLESFGNDAR